MLLHTQIMNIMEDDFEIWANDEEEPTPSDLKNIEKEEDVDSWDIISCRGCRKSFSLLQCRGDGENLVCPHCGVRNG